MRGYAIWIGGYFHMSGGIRALHVLRDELRKRDLQAHMTWESPIQPGEIVVYPEIVADNHEQADHYVHWLLNRATPPGRAFAWESGMGDWPLLTVDIIERDLWTPYEGHRSGVGYWIGKGAADLSQVPDGAVEVHRGNFHTRQELADWLRRLDYFISFDPFSAINIEAAVSGTPVLILAEGSWGRADFERHDWVRHGVAWSWDELEQAREEAHLAYWDYQHKRREFDQRIDRFVTLTQEWFA